MSETSTTVSTGGSGHRMQVPWERMASLRRRLLQTLFALAPLVLLAAGIHPALAVLPALFPLFILIRRGVRRLAKGVTRTDRKSTRLNSSHVSISYAVFCLKKKRER